MGILLGSTFGALLKFYLSEDELLSWGWRIPFWCSFFCAAIGMYLRSNVDEPEEFANLQDRGDVSRQPISEALREYPIQIFLLSMCLGTASVVFYVYFVWLPVYLTDMIDEPIGNALIINSIALAGYSLFFPIAGFMSDKVLDRANLIVMGAVGITILAVPGFYVLRAGDWHSIIAVQLLIGLLQCMMTASIPAWVVESFPTRVRYSAVAIGYNFCQAIFGGLAPLIATLLTDHDNSNLAAGYFVAAVGLLSTLCLATSGIWNVYYYRNTEELKKSDIFQTEEALTSESDKLLP